MLPVLVFSQSIEFAGGTFKIDESGGCCTMDSLNSTCSSQSTADDGTITITSSIAGWGFVMIGDAQEYTTFYFTSAGVVTLGSDATANTANTDSNGDLCIYDGGDHIVLKNRLGSRLTIAYFIKYFLP